MPQLQPGRIVHYALPELHPRAGEVRPAMIVRVWQQLDNPHHPGMSNLCVFLDGGNDNTDLRFAVAPMTMWAGSVHYDESGKPGTWRWPPRD